jgi:hypothetical protein
MPRNEDVEGITHEHEKSLTVNEEIACKKIINCTNTSELRNVGSYLYNVKRKWVNRIMKLIILENRNREPYDTKGNRQ